MELLAFVLQHPATDQETKDRAGQVLVDLKNKLPSQMALRAQEKGRAKKLGEVVAELLQEENS